MSPKSKKHPEEQSANDQQTSAAGPDPSLSGAGFPTGADAEQIRKAHEASETTPTFTSQKPAAKKNKK